MNAAGNATWSADAVPARLPHFQLRGGSLFFLLSRRPHATLDEEQQAVWNAIDGVACTGDLRTRFRASVDAILRRFVELRVCVLLTARFPPNRRRIVVFEPHMDDATFSVGGTMWLRRNECEFTLVTVTGVSNSTSYQGRNQEYFDIKTISGLRQAESALVARLLGGRHLTLNVVEASLRYCRSQWTLDWYERHRQSINAFREHCAGSLELEEWTAAIAEAIGNLDPHEMWMPLGVGLHTDHQLIRQAYLNILGRNPELAQACVIKLFQDVPYAAMFPNHTASLVKTLRDAGACLEEERVNISHAMSSKLDLLSLFGSQFKLAVLRPRVETCARCAGGQTGNYGELFFRLALPPSAKIEPLSCYAERDTVYRIVQKLAPWVHRNRRAAAISILSAKAFGRWGEDMRFLLDVFPEARFEVHLPKACLAETESLVSLRIVVTPIPNRWRNWLATASRALLRGAHPLVLLPGRGREGCAKIFNLFNFHCDSIVAPTMNDFVMALRLTGN
jgi:LmbE family N-acetylglucosaminyl deacetylase